MRFQNLRKKINNEKIFPQNGEIQFMFDLAWRLLNRSV